MNLMCGADHNIHFQTRILRNWWSPRNSQNCMLCWIWRFVTIFKRGHRFNPVVEIQFSLLVSLPSSCMNWKKLMCQEEDTCLPE